MHLPRFPDGAYRPSLFFLVSVPSAASQSKIDMLSRSRNRYHEWKRYESTIVALEAIATQLRESLFTVRGYAFDGDSCVNRLHDGFQDA
jgi:hypothetical protein